MLVRLEHANLTVKDIEGVIRFLKAAFPEFRVRHEAIDASGSRWVHIGNDQTYVALTQAMPDAERRCKPYSGNPGLNHLGFEVADVEAVRSRLHAAGYLDSTVPNRHPYRKRVYFHDPDGNDWEFIEYLSDNLSQRHDYELLDG